MYQVTNPLKSPPQATDIRVHSGLKRALASEMYGKAPVIGNAVGPPLFRHHVAFVDPAKFGSSVGQDPLCPPSLHAVPFQMSVPQAVRGANEVGLDVSEVFRRVNGVATEVGPGSVIIVGSAASLFASVALDG